MRPGGRSRPQESTTHTKAAAWGPHPLCPSVKEPLLCQQTLAGRLIARQVLRPNVQQTARSRAATPSVGSNDARQTANPVG